MSKNFVLIILLFSLQSCITQEWYMENSICESEALQKFPPFVVKEFRTVYDTISEPDGTLTCVNKTEGSGNTSTVVTHCQQGMRTKKVPRQELADVDKNDSYRRNYSARCTTTRCISIYGNSECKIPK